MKPITGKASLSVLLGAAFLMATSSIGPGFMLQTAAFTGQLKADFAFAIVVSVIFSIIAQLNVWTIIGVSQMRGQDIANKVLPGLGYFVAFLISLGGLAFNIGNIGGASMGLNIVFGIGTVGGYITFSGGHRLIDAGITGREHLKDVRRAAFMGMSVDAIVRILLFLAVLGVVSMGFALDPKDPAGSAFLLGAGEIGHKLFGIVFFCAALTSVVGAAYTSVSFLKTLFKVVERYEKLTIMAFIFVSTCILIFIGKPATLLIVAGSVNGLILPVTLAVMLLATRKTNIVGDYKHNPILFYTGWIVVLVTAYIGVTSLQGIAKLLG